MRAVYRFLAMRLFIDPETPAPVQVWLIDYGQFEDNRERVIVTVRDLDQLMAWATVLVSAEFRATWASGTRPGNAHLAVSFTGELFGQTVADLVISCPALPSIPPEVRALVKPDVQAA
jgi:hypothetical protein